MDWVDIAFAMTPNCPRALGMKEFGLGKIIAWVSERGLATYEWLVVVSEEKGLSGLEWTSSLSGSIR
jgi:hypothetical protein